MDLYVKEMGCQIIKAHRIWCFKQRTWLPPFMKAHTDKRTAAIDEVARGVLTWGPNTTCDMLLQNTSKYKNTSSHQHCCLGEG